MWPHRSAHRQSPPIRNGHRHPTHTSTVWTLLSACASSSSSRISNSSSSDNTSTTSTAVFRFFLGGGLAEVGKKTLQARRAARKFLQPRRDLGTQEAKEHSQALLGKEKPTRTIVVSSRNSSRTSTASSKSASHKVTLRVSSSASTKPTTNSRASSPGASAPRSSVPRSSASRSSAPRSPPKSSKHDDKRAGSSDAKTKKKSSRGRSPSSILPPLMEQDEESKASINPNLSDVSFASESDGSSRIGDTDGAPPRKAGKPKSADYAGSDLELLEETIDKVCQRLLVTGWFISTKEYNPLIVRAWRHSVRKLGLQPSRKRITIRKMRAMKYRVTSFQGRMKQAIKSQLVYHFKLDRGTTEEIGERAKKCASKDAVKHALFVRKKSGASMGSSIATKYADKFRCMPLPTIALISALAHFLLKSFIPGELPTRDKKKRKSKKRAAELDGNSSEDSVDDSIDRAKIVEFYDLHLNNLENLRKGDAATLAKLRTSIWKTGSTFAKYKSPVKGRVDSESSDDGVITLATIVQGRQSRKDAGTAKASAPVPASRKTEGESDEETDAWLKSPTRSPIRTPTRSKVAVSAVYLTPSLAQPKDTPSRPSKLVAESVSIPRLVKPKMKVSRADSTPANITSTKAHGSQGGKGSDADSDEGEADDESEDGEKGGERHQRGGERREDEDDKSDGARSDCDRTLKQRATTSGHHGKRASVINASTRKKRQANLEEEESMTADRASTSTKRRKHVDE
ncbi:hypothetical protein FRC12_024948 [Ceratobasidium sp. 428]|nr:hypothetical protein FRC12_024948 [Ceratobasidium sp. 428]